MDFLGYTLRETNIAMENHYQRTQSPISNSELLVITRGYIDSLVNHCLGCCKSLYISLLIATHIPAYNSHHEPHFKPL